MIRTTGAGLTRRTLLSSAGRGSLILAAASAGAWLTGCGSNAAAGQNSTDAAGPSGGSEPAVSSGATSASGGTATAGVKLGWIPNVEYSGIFVGVADGQYAKAGLTVDVVPGGPNSPVVPLVTAGKVLVGIEAIPENVATAVTNGAALKIVGAGLQKSPECWVSLADNPITEPKAIEGKKLGVTLAGKNTALVFMKRNGVDVSKVTLVPIQFDPAPLAAKEIDALWGFASNQPVALGLRGLKTHVMPLADFGFNRMQDVYFVTAATLADPTARATAKKFLAASRAAWAAALGNQQHAAQVTVDKYGKDLGLKLDDQAAQLKAIAPYMSDQAAPTAAELFRMSDGLVAETIASLGSIGIKADRSLFTNELLD